MHEETIEIDGETFALSDVLEALGPLIDETDNGILLGLQDGSSGPD